MKRVSTKMETGDSDDNEGQVPEEVLQMFQELRLMIQALQEEGVEGPLDSTTTSQQSCTEVRNWISTCLSFWSRRLK